MDGEFLLRVARAAIAEKLAPHYFGRRTTGPTGHSAAGTSNDIPGWAAEPGAAFVTLTVDGRLRGCIGSLEAHRPLVDDVRDNARAAAFRDPRFPPLSRDEFDKVRIEVSVLSPPAALPVADRDDARARLRPGIDGVVLRAQGRRATFLPQVWEQLPDPDMFLSHLLRKAGLSDYYWGPDVRLERYTVSAYHEPEPCPARAAPPGAGPA